MNILSITPYVSGYVTGTTALAMNAMSQHSVKTIVLLVDDERLHEKMNPVLSLFYDPLYDKQNFLWECPDNPKLLVPEPERALLDFMRAHGKWNLESMFFAMDDYLSLYGDGSWSKVYKMADFYSIPHSLIDYWRTEREDVFLH